MKIGSERPRIWYVLVPLVAMFYLIGFHPWRFFVFTSPLCWFFGALLVSVWLFLIYDLIRQIALFFRKRAK